MVYGIFTGRTHCCQYKQNMKTSFTPGKIWNDTEGTPIQVHGGGVLYFDGIYYWFGENRNGTTKECSAVGFNTDAIGVSCYASTDLYNWENKGLALDAVSDLLSSTSIPGKSSNVRRLSITNLPINS